MKKISKSIPIRVVRKKVYVRGHHGGAWKVAYADFVTAMMALFIVLWIIGQSKEIKDSVGEYFVDPIAYNQKMKSGVLEKSKGSKIISKPDAKEAEDEKARFKILAAKIKDNLINKIQVKKLKNQIVIEIVKEGMRIELMESSEAFFFDIGTAKLKPEAEEVLSVIAEEISKLPNHLILEGHTDSRPYASTGGYTNFELSSDRANAARRVLIKSGILFENIDQVRGYANTMLRNSQDSYDVTNRRISIIVKYEGKGNE
jgi:chemotaxis protein MotB